MTKLTKEELSIIGEIVKRSQKLGLVIFDNITLFMDLQVALQVFNLKLSELLLADEANFSHDILGIQNNINRKEKQFLNCFLPRYAE